MTKSSLNINRVVEKLYSLRIGVFLVVTIAIFGFTGWQVWQAINVEPATSSEATASAPKIDQTTVDKIRSLQDSSVQVRSLFDEARRNPFQE